MNVFSTFRPLLLIPLVAAGMLSGCGSVGTHINSSPHGVHSRPASATFSQPSPSPGGTSLTFLTEPQDGWSP